MSIKINRSKCIGCGMCRLVCPGSLLYADKAGKAFIKYPKDCWGCTSCVKECSVSAINYYLGADIGGKGSTLHTRMEENLIHWIITSPQGEEKVITIDRSKANEY